MNIFKKIALKLRIIKPESFKIKLRHFLNSLNKLFRFKSWKSKVLVGVFVVLALGTGSLMVYSQSGGGGSIGGSSLNKGLIAHWSLDVEEYEEGTVNLVPNPDGKIISNGTPGSFINLAGIHLYIMTR